MRFLCKAAPFAMATALAIVAVAGEADTMAKLDEALKGVATFEHGGDAGPLKTVESIVISIATDPEQRRAAEQRLIAGLKAAKTFDARSFLCRQLRTIGTARCVPVLEPLLTDLKLSHMARYALGRIEAPEAAAALRRALGRTRGRLLVGVINTIGRNRDAKALPDLVKLLGSRDAAVARAAAHALGIIDGLEAAKALEAARGEAPGELRPTIDRALMTCAEGLLASGNNAEAARIYQMFYNDRAPRQFRIGAFRGLVAAQGEKGAALLVHGIKSDDPELRATAIALAAETEGTGATRRLAGMLPTLPADAQVLLLHALGQRGDAAALPAVLTGAKSEEEAVRVAALAALGRLGDGAVVGLLVTRAATAGGGEQQVARRSLTRLGGDDVDAALIKAAASGASKARVEAIRALASRGATRAVDQLLIIGRLDDDRDVRGEAIRALGDLVDAARLDSLVRLVLKPKDAKDRSAVEAAAADAFRRVADKDKQTAIVLGALSDAAAEAKPALLRLLARTATPKALGVVRAALKDPDEAVRDAAIRGLADWPTAAPADALLDLARTVESRVHKVLAVRGYVRMAGLSGNPTGMLVRVIELAERPEDKKLILAGLAAADPQVALKIVEPYLGDEALRDEAAMAAIQIADRLRQKDKKRARQVIAKVLAAVENEAVREKAQEVINQIDQFEGYIRDWLVSPHYQEKGKDARALFGIAFPPEQPDAKDVKWTKLTKGIGDWEINLTSAVGGINDVAVYLRTRVWSPAEQDVQLELGSDDAIKVWLGGKAIHANNTDRGVAPRQDIAKATLAKGWNDLVLKVINHGGGWAAACRIRKVGGAAIEGLKYEAK